MYDDDEEDLALLQQYEDQNARSSINSLFIFTGVHCDSSDNDLDSDLEDRIMSAVEYGINQDTPRPQQQEQQQQQQSKETVEQHTKTRSTIPPIDMTQPGTDSSSGEDSSDDNDTHRHTNKPQSVPPIIHHIDLNLTNKQLPYDESTDEEEKELNYELQQLIDNQVIICNTCGNPGHMGYQCDLCGECGQKRHTTSYCPGLDYCRRCKQRGHFSSECDNAACRDSCRYCGDDIHASQCCPTLVHVYIDEVPPHKTVKRFCYNCGDKGHFGDATTTTTCQIKKLSTQQTWIKQQQ
ncbi:hypothetical protein BC941DRAFT_455720 [Chlamydoabsidia padenii]|nr:hypothetical protein BC941DRAFT_455720 [Chlamydoabsidia padenii]